MSCCRSIMKCFKHNSQTYIVNKDNDKTYESQNVGQKHKEIDKEKKTSKSSQQNETVIQHNNYEQNSNANNEDVRRNENNNVQSNDQNTSRTSSVAPSVNSEEVNLLEEIERRPGVPLAPANADQNLDVLEINYYPKDKNTEDILRRAILKNEFFRYVFDEKDSVAKERLQKCIDAMHLVTINQGEFIINEGDKGEELYVSIEGTFEVTKGDMVLKVINESEVFGELAILYNTPRFASIQAKTFAKVYALDQKVYRKIMLQTIKEEHERNANFLRKLSTFKDLHDSVIEKVGNLLKQEFFETGTKIVKQGEKGDKFYIIKAGAVLVTKTNEDKVEEQVNKLKEGDFFGELALLKEEFRQATVTAQAPGVECLTLDRKNFIEHFGGSIEELKNIDYSKPVSQPPAEPTGEFSYIKLEDLEVVATLGVGGFGRVELVQYKHNREHTFALKYLKKLDMVLQQQQEHAFNEKLIMNMCNSDFICKLYNTYRNDKYLYFLMEVCLGGDLWTVLQKQKNRCVDEKTAQFFSGCVIEAFDYLHKKNIVYRDLKPENLLLDSAGYIKLVDFGFAKIIAATNKTYTFAGTPEYVAPEIILNKGHDKAVDYWALGIFIHELIMGKPPFRASDHLRTYNLIIRGIDNIELSEKMTKTVRALIRRLCRAVASDRLGCQKNGMDDVRSHKWFEKFNWEQLRSRRMTAPIKPKIRSNTDMSNFDNYPKDSDIPPSETSGWDEGF